MLVVLLVLSLAFSVSARMKYTQEACKIAPYQIWIRVEGVRSATGWVTTVLYGDNPDEFLAKGKKLAKIRVPAQLGEVNVCLIAPNVGTYAVAVYHDENGNKKFDKNWMGLPVEGFGVSNNPTYFLVPPSHAEAAFSVDAHQKTLTILLKY